MNEIPQPTRTAAAVSDGDQRESDIISHKKKRIDREEEELYRSCDAIARRAKWRSNLKKKLYIYIYRTLEI